MCSNMSVKLELIHEMVRSQVCGLTQKNLECFFIAVSDYQCLSIIHAYRDAQNKPAWRDKTCATHT